MSDVGDRIGGDAQDRAESVDVEVISDDRDDPEGALQYPPDRLQGAQGYGTTAAEERVDEPLEERLRREVRDPLDDVEEPDARELDEIEAEALYADDTLDDTGFETDADDELDADEAIARARPVGWLVGPGAEDDGYDLVDDESDAVARSVEDEDDDLSAEEEAVHLTAEPPFSAAGDGYVSESS